MKHVNKLVAISAVVFITGCSTAGDYYKSVDNTNARNVEIAVANARAEEARYSALARIAATGDATTKVAAAMALALGGVKQTQQAAVAQPMQSEALQWASVLVPGVTQGMSIYYNTKTAINASDNSTKLGVSTNQTFKHFATEINDPTIVEQAAPVVLTQPTPIVVTQPAPTVITQPAPVIVSPEVVKPEIVNPVIVQPTVQ